MMAIEANFLLDDKGEVFQDDLLKKISSFNDEIIESLLIKQISDPEGRWDGGVKDIYEVPHAHATMNFVIKLSGAYASQKQ